MHVTAALLRQKKVAREQELMQPVIDKINKFMELWGAKHGYRFVFGTMAGGNIVMADRKYDVTTKVIQDLNEHYKKAMAGFRKEVGVMYQQREKKAKIYAVKHLRPQAFMGMGKPDVCRIKKMDDVKTTITFMRNKRISRSQLANAQTAGCGFTIVMASHRTR
ncbi:MAG TPA: OmpH family outer membrane protein [Chitinispirillaceae bacterium]|nr:OmpH family outer membrane protein [Chitinispirillaceae bacterium]